MSSSGDALGRRLCVGNTRANRRVVERGSLTWGTWLLLRCMISYSYSSSRSAASSVEFIGKLADWLFNLRCTIPLRNLDLSFKLDTICENYRLANILNSRAVAKFIYTTFIAHLFMWSLVYLRWRGAASWKQRLNEGQVTENNRYELEGWSWSWVESYTSTLR